MRITRNLPNVVTGGTALLVTNPRAGERRVKVVVSCRGAAGNIARLGGPNLTTTSGAVVEHGGSLTLDDFGGELWCIAESGTPTLSGFEEVEVSSRGSGVE